MSLVDLCLTLPHTEAIQKLYMQRTDGKLRVILDEIFAQENCLGDAPSCVAALKTLQDSLFAINSCAFLGRGVLETVCGNYLFETLQALFDAHGPSAARADPLPTENDSESSATDDELASAPLSPALVYNKFFLILKLCPGAASVLDKSGLSLLHHLLLHFTAVHTHEDSRCDDFYRVLFMLCRAVYIAHPPHMVEEAITEHGKMTPLQLLLRNPSSRPLDFELAGMAFAQYPQCARALDVQGRLPIHYVIDKLSHMQPPSGPSLALLKQLLAFHPDGAFHTIREEVRSIRIIQHASSGDEGERTFSFQTKIVEWTPVERARSCDVGVERVFTKFLETMAMKRIKSQVRR